MSRSRARTGNSVSLFPFLAVLVCAMGALIFLLIVTTRRIRSEALAKAKAVQEEPDQTEEEKPKVFQPSHGVSLSPRVIGQAPLRIQEPAPPVEPERIEPIPGVVELGTARSKPILPEPPKPKAQPRPVQEIIWPAAIAEKPAPPDPNRPLIAKLDQLKKAKADWLAVIANKEQTAARLKNEVDDFTKALATINSQIEDAAEKNLQDNKMRRELEQSRARALGQLAKVQQDIDAAKNRAIGAPTKFQVVPFDGQTGTNYRPIIIECTAAGMRFQPEGVLLTMDDFDGFTLGKNPLLAGARALSDYWLKQSVKTGSPGPYVLLIVRPSGAKYFAAKKLLEALDRPFGYELVEENLPIDVPAADPVATELCRNAVEGTLRERENLKRLLVSHGPEMLGRNPNYRVVPKPEGGFDVEYAPGGRRKLGGIGQDPGDDSSLPQVDRYGQPYRSSPPGQDVENQRGPQPFGAGQSDPNDKRYPQRVPRGTGNGIARNPYVNPPGDRANAVDPLGRPLGNGRGTIGKTDPNEPGRLPEDVIRRSQGNRPYNGDGNNGDSGNGNDNGAVGSETVNAPPPSTTGNLGTETSAAQQEPNGAGGQVDRETPGGGSATPQENTLVETPGANIDGPMNETNASNPAGIRSPNGTSAASPGSENVATNSPAESSLENGQPGNAALSGEPGGGREPAMPNFLSMNARRMKREETIQRRWGISDPRASIGFEREVTVRIEGERLIVGNAFAVSYTAKTTGDQLAAGMLEALEMTVRKWGRPPQSFYWVPTLRFEVVGASRVPVYQRLSRTARAWGLETTAEAIQN